jgi:hypothetical protein
MAFPFLIQMVSLALLSPNFGLTYFVINSTPSGAPVISLGNISSTGSPRIFTWMFNNEGSNDSIYA